MASDLYDISNIAVGRGLKIGTSTGKSFFRTPAGKSVDDVYYGKASKQNHAGDTCWSPDLIVGTERLLRKAADQASTAAKQAWAETRPTTETPGDQRLLIYGGELPGTTRLYLQVVSRGELNFTADTWTHAMSPVALALGADLLEAVGHHPQAAWALLQALRGFVAWCAQVSQYRRAVADYLVGAQGEALRQLRAQVIHAKLQQPNADEG